MKKIILLLFSLFTLAFLNPNITTAASKRCSSVPLTCVATGSFCKTEGFDCSKEIELDKQDCNDQGGCSETIGCGWNASYSVCYLSKDAPPIPEECGYIGRKCCGDDKDSWSCHEGAPEPHDLILCTCTPSKDSSFIDATKPKACCIGQKVTKTFDSSVTGSFQYQVCPEEEQGIQTALGCIPTSTAPFVNYVLKRAVSIGGGIAFILMLVGAFVLITSAGNPENVKKGKDIITSATIGLLFIIFAVFLLKFIGVDILKLPEFDYAQWSFRK